MQRKVDEMPVIMSAPENTNCCNLTRKNTKIPHGSR